MATDVGVVAHVTEGRLKGRRANQFQVIGWCQSDGLGDECIVPNGLELSSKVFCLFFTGAQKVSRGLRPRMKRGTHTCHTSICYDPGTLPQFSTIFYSFILRSRSLVPHSFPYAPLGPPPNHLTSHLMDHLTNPQSTITCHHSAVRSIPQHYHLSSFELPAHDGLFLDCQLMMELYLEPPRHDKPY